MFDKYLIVDDSVRNFGPAGAPDGFSIGVRLGYYRGLGLSMVEDLALVVDGEGVDPGQVRFDEGPGALPLVEMAQAYDRRWEFGAVAVLSVARPGGLAAGSHQIELTERLRISYLPFPLVAADSKTIEVA